MLTQEILNQAQRDSAVKALHRACLLAHSPRLADSLSAEYGITAEQYRSAFKKLATFEEDMTYEYSPSEIAVDKAIKTPNAELGEMKEPFLIFLSEARKEKKFTAEELKELFLSFVK